MTTQTQNPTIVEAGTAFMRAAGLDGALPPSASAAETDRRASTRGMPERFEVIVIGGGQAGLAVGHHLKQQGARFLILDASERVGDAWRKRWDSLCLFSPAWGSSLDGLRFPGPPNALPTKDQMADYLESYAAHFELPVRSSTCVESLTRNARGFVVKTPGGSLEADKVIIAMASYQQPRMPDFARELGPNVVQMHSRDYRNPGQLRPGRVVVVGGGNSGVEIARDLCATHQVVLAAPKVPEIPVSMTNWIGTRLFARIQLRLVFHYLLTIHTPMGRRARPKMARGATPLIRTKRHDLARAGVHFAERVTGVRDGRLLTGDGQALEADNVIWCTGFGASQSFIQLPIFDDEGQPMHEAGVVTSQPGLYFVGLPFMYSASSSMIHGVSRDAKRIAAVACAAQLPSEQTGVSEIAMLQV